MIKSINPSNFTLLQSYETMQLAEVNKIINLTNTVFEDWKKSSFSQRSKLMTNAAGVLRKKSEEYSKLMTLEMGKPIAQSRAEIEKCAWVSH